MTFIKWTIKFVSLLSCYMRVYVLTLMQQGQPSYRLIYYFNKSILFVLTNEPALS